MADYIGEKGDVQFTSTEKDGGFAGEFNSKVAADLLTEARLATEAEHRMTLREGFQKYPKAILWSFLLSTSIVMEGYDLVCINSFYAFPPFVKKYGALDAAGKFNISAPWQSGLSNGVQCGSLIGLMLNGWLADRYGYKKTMIGALFSMICFIFITFFSKNIGMLLAGELLCGIPWGIFQTLSTAYASEIVPVSLRPVVTSYVNVAWIIGQLIATGVLRGLLNNTTQWAYRIPFAIQWVWPVPIMIGALLAPESPWWLVRHGRVDEAREVLHRLTISSNYDGIDNTVAMMVHTNELERAVSAGTTFFDCFKGIDLRRTECSVMVWSIQQACGSSLMGYSTYFLEQAGFSSDKSFDLAMGQYAIGLVGTLSAWVFTSRFGRRDIYIWGLVILTVILVVVGGLGCAPASNNGAVWGVGVGLLVFTLFYDLTVGPVCYSLVAELSSTRLRAKTVALSRFGYNIVGIVCNVIMPQFLNTTALNIGAKTAFFWAGVNVLCITWCFFRLPEPAGRTFGELDILFERKISARKFSSTVVEQYVRGNDVPEGTDSKESKNVPTIEHHEVR